MWRNIEISAPVGRESYPGTDVFKALGDETRLRAYIALKRGELCVCQLVEFLQLAPSTVSKHLSILKTAGLIDGRKNGRWVYYRLRDRTLSPAFDSRLESLIQTIADTRTAREDQKRLQKILKVDPEVLCQIQRS